MDNNYTFRIRVVVPSRLSINSSEKEIELTSEEKRDVFLKSAETDKSISEAKSLVITSSGYRSAEAAQQDAERWQDILKISFSRLKIGIDFGDRAPISIFTEAGLSILSEAQGGRRVLNDYHGLSTFPTIPKPLFVKAQADVVIGKNINTLLETIEEAKNTSVDVSIKIHIAYDLFAASFFQSSEDARFLTLMMAIETLLVQAPQSDEIVQYIENLISATDNSELSKEQKTNMKNALKMLMRQSIGQSGRILAECLGEKKYDGMAPSKLFKTCYSLRSDLVHGRNPRPSRELVGKLAAQLEIFVGDILSIHLG